MNNFHLNADIATSMGISRRTAQKFLNPSKKKTRKMDGSNPKDIRQTLNLATSRGEKPKPPLTQKGSSVKKKAA
jgi:hypothetical protein